MKIYCLSDIHGCISEFDYALSLIETHLIENNTKLILLGDYIHGGPDSYGVLDKIIELQRKYGVDKCMALMGNHEDMACCGRWPIAADRFSHSEDNIDEAKEDRYVQWMMTLPRYYFFYESNIIFVHAGVEEEAGDMWEWATDDFTFTEKYPAQTGKFYDNYKIVAGHIGTEVISEDPRFHDIYYDGESHYYIDGTVLESGVIPILMVDTETDKYYRVTENGNFIILPYDEEDW
ncbi:metallophosphoesterase [Sedimentibacter sp. zth1]|uniref:metallophosphoesterase n=1 Tax=Sedimentibacter sp. zth1 TaxID=2816908 RepID=UPI001A92DB62|nr:metallophosphoesterase [Sedimentibacter sp. zth1]QSX04780.1 metallophosphoesterase [Sedimentibacter sp. zth1]